MANKTYRFKYHYYKQYNEMFVCFRGICYRAKNVECLVPCETKWKNRQPKLIMQGFASKIEQVGNKIIIS